MTRASREFSYLHQILDEICLEGLDGITLQVTLASHWSITQNTRLSLVNNLQALWVRLENRPAYSLGLSERAKQFIWECVLSLEDVSLYQLEVAR